MQTSSTGRARGLRIAAAALLVCCVTSINGQLSKPVALDSQVDTKANKFLQRRAVNDDTVPNTKYGLQHSPLGECIFKPIALNGFLRL